MIVVCPKCSSRLQATGEKPPVHPFSIRCPKCNSIVNSEAPSPASEHGALAGGSSPSTEHRRSKSHVPFPAPLFEVEGAKNQPTDQPPADDLARLLANLLGQSNTRSNSDATARPAWDPRRVLLCTAEAHRNMVALQLTENGYQVFVALDTRQAVERMRENRLDVVLLDPEFDVAEQGAAFVTREVNVLRPAQRRRLFFVLMSPNMRTMESHAAFLSNVNAIVNAKELEELPRILDHALREYNELYKEFNVALNVAGL